MKLTNGQRRMVRRLAFISGEFNRSRAGLADFRREKAELLSHDLRPALDKLIRRLAGFDAIGFAGGTPASYTEALTDASRKRDELLESIREVEKDIEDIDRELSAVAENTAQAVGLVERVLDYSGLSHEDFPSRGAAVFGNTLELHAKNRGGLHR